MKTNFFLICFFILSIFTANAQCGALFTSVQSSSLVSFTNSSTTPTINNYNVYSWSFGDGSVSNLESPNHLYITAGTYTVSLSQTMIDSSTSSVLCTSTYTTAVTTLGSFSCGAAPMVSTLAGGTNAINFTFTSGFTPPAGLNYVSFYNINYGDGTSNTVWPGTIDNHYYTASGNYTVSVTESIVDPNNNTTVYCVSAPATLVVPIVYISPCTLLPAFTATSQGSNSIYLFSNTSTSLANGAALSESFTIEYGDGITEPIGYIGNTTHFYPVAGTYNVCITRTLYDSTNSMIACTNSFCNNIVVANTSPAYTGCDANFTINLDSNTSGNIVYYFSSANSTVQNGTTIASYAWSFGDGGTSTASDVSHTYATAGVYQVCLTITSANGCSDVTCFDVAVSANNVANTYISGVASFLVNGTSYYPDNLNLYLLKYDAVTQQLNLVQSLNTGSQPNYYFSYVPAGNYIIKAAPSPSNIAYNSIIVPTYSINALLWSSATTYTVASGTPVYNADINMQLGVSTSGPGLITGSVLTGANKTRAVGDPKKGLTVLLFNKANGKIINYTKTDTDGVFQFVNLPLGTYKIFLEETGKTMVAAEITITNNTQKAENVDFVSNKKENHPLGYFPSSNNNVIVQKGDFIIYPNPMQDYVNISSGLLLALDVQVEAIGIDGKIVLSEKMIPTNNTIQLNTSNFKKGMYIIKVTSKDNTYTTQITKQ